MTSNAPRTVEEIRAEQRRLAAELKAAKRAAAKAAKEALVSAHQRLGQIVSETVGVDTPEAVEALQQVLLTDQVSRWLRDRLRPENGTAEVPVSDQAVSEESGHAGPDYHPERGYDQAVA